MSGYYAAQQILEFYFVKATLFELGFQPMFAQCVQHHFYMLQVFLFCLGKRSNVIQVHSRRLFRYGANNLHIFVL
jgi:hypothetical protein